MSRYIPNTEEDRARMMAAIGISSIDELFADIPEELKLKMPMNLPESMPELELDAHMKRLACMNAHSGSSICFLGAGAYDHFVPSIVRHVVSKTEFYTSYTPYQPEISQGMLQAIFEYQTMICRLTGMDVSNASMYDGATAVAEAAMMAVRATGGRGIAVSAGVHPEYREVLKTYAKFNGIDITEVGLEGLRTDKNKLVDAISGKAAVILQSPNFFGAIEDVGHATGLAAKNGALTIVCADPVSLAILEPPGSLGADIAVGDGQPLGNPLNFGGPYFGFLAAKRELLRKIPGRIVGQTTDRDGKSSFVLTLQAREQHIRREKAVSNICSNQALNALAAAAYLSVMGKEGLKGTANLCLRKSHYAYERLLATGKFEEVDDSPFFKEFTVRAKNEKIRDINKRLLRHGITGGLELERYFPDMSGCWLVAVTEKRTRQEIDLLVKIAAGGEGHGE
jgi:glycine dehydrogenase subunit 1